MLRVCADAFETFLLVVIRRPDDGSYAHDAGTATASHDSVSFGDTVVRDTMEAKQSVPDVYAGSRFLGSLWVFLCANRVELLSADLPNITKLPPTDCDRVVSEVVGPH
jgi:hypothetical protein